MGSSHHHLEGLLGILLHEGDECQEWRAGMRQVDIKQKRGTEA